MSPSQLAHIFSMSSKRKPNGLSFSNPLEAFFLSLESVKVRASGQRSGMFTLSNKMKISFPDYWGFLRSYREIFSDQTYYFSTKSNTNSPNILDCGGNIGLSVIFFKILYPNAKIMVFEPDPVLVEFIKTNLSKNSITGVEVIPYAVLDKETELDLFDDKRGITLGNSLFQNFFSGEKKKVRSVKLSKYIDSHVDMLKIDIEGSETAVLEELHREGKLALVDKMIIEYHPQINPEGNSLSRLLSLLEKEGFSYNFGENRNNSFAEKSKQGVFMVYCNK